MKLMRAGWCLLPILSGCVSDDQLRRERYVGEQDGRSVYRFWIYRDWQAKGWGEKLCGKRGWQELSRETGERDLYFASGVPISHQRTYVTIACAGLPAPGTPVQPPAPPPG